MLMNTSKSAISFGSSKQVIGEVFFSCGCVTETTDGSEGVIRPEIVRINVGAHKILGVKFAPVLPNRVSVFTRKNGFSDLKAEFIK